MPLFFQGQRASLTSLSCGGEYNNLWLGPGGIVLGHSGEALFPFVMGLQRVQWQLLDCRETACLKVVGAHCHWL